jgi:hypothetical protein
MNKITSGLVTAALLVASGSSQAREVDFIGRIMNISVESTAVNNARVVSVAAFDDSNISTYGSYTVTFRVTNTNLEVPEEVFFGSATITPSQTEVQVGTLNTGRITLTYDSATDRVEAKFQLNVGPKFGASYEVVAFDNINWRGTANVVSSVQL